jgi:nitrate reductase gamma subunit
MSLLDFARGPALLVAVVVFLAGTAWRLVGVLFLRDPKDLSEPRAAAAWKGIRLIALRSWPRREFLAGSAFSEIAGYTFHVGFLAVLLFNVRHVRGLGNWLAASIGSHTPAALPWPTLGATSSVVLSLVALVALLATLVHRMISPVKRLISNFDDYFSWLVTVAPLVTGLVLALQPEGPRPGGLLAAHYLSVDALLLWFPWGKLIHAFTLMPVRAITGMRFERKGATL